MSSTSFKNISEESIYFFLSDILNKCQDANRKSEQATINGMSETVGKQNVYQKEYDEQIKQEGAAQSRKTWKCSGLSYTGASMVGIASAMIIAGGVIGVCTLSAGPLGFIAGALIGGILAAVFLGLHFLTMALTETSKKEEGGPSSTQQYFGGGSSGFDKNTCSSKKWGFSFARYHYDTNPDQGAYYAAKNKADQYNYEIQDVLANLRTQENTEYSTEQSSATALTESCNNIWKDLNTLSQSLVR